MQTIIQRLYSQYLLTRRVTTDSRKITPGCLFFAFRGENFDGNAFAPQALEQGAALCVVSDPRFGVDERCIVVDDVLEVLQQLASYHRSQLSIPVIGITGTNGKTTSKELVSAVLSKRYRTFATCGNFNNHLGVPLTLLSIPEDAEIAVVEMGANHPGEIDFLCGIAQPDFGLVTNVGKAHLEGFGSFEGVVRTKTELYRFVAAQNGTLFVNAGNAVLMDASSALATIPDQPSMVPGYIPGLPSQMGACHEFSQLSVVTYGSGDESEIKGTLVGSNPYMKFYVEQDDKVYTIQSHLIGNYNFDNAMAAVAVGLYFNVDMFDIKEAIESYEPTNNRSQYKRTAKNELILDCYNANPSSMKVAIDNFKSMNHSKKVLMVGSMKELGTESEKEHSALVGEIMKCGFDQVVLVGDEFVTKPEDGSILCFSNVDEAVAYFAQHPVEGALVLLKGSNSTRMGRMEEVL